MARQIEIIQDELFDAREHVSVLTRELAQARHELRIMRLVRESAIRKAQEDPRRVASPKTGVFGGSRRVKP